MTHQRLQASKSAVTLTLAALFLPFHHGFVFSPSFFTKTKHHKHQNILHLIPPLGSGYEMPEEETDFLPETYDPMMEYPGTMRPGRTPENIPYQDLPIADTDPEPVPWPHLQQIEWHHRWEPSGERPMDMEEFIEQQGLWMTRETQEEMLAGNRRQLQRIREAREAAKEKRVITDDDDDDETENKGIINLGDGRFGQLGSVRERESTESQATEESATSELDAFLLDLGLDVDLGIAKDETKTNEEESAKKDSKKSDTPSPIDATSVVVKSTEVEEADDDELLEGVDGPLVDAGTPELVDNDDIFGDGGFDFEADEGFDEPEGFDFDSW